MTKIVKSNLARDAMRPVVYLTGSQLAMQLPRKPSLSNKHIEERLKLGASCLQALALALTGVAVLAPLFVSRTDPDWRNAVATIIAALLEGAAFILLRYIPTAATP